MNWPFYILLFFITFSFSTNSLAEKENCPNVEIKRSLKQLDALTAHQRFHSKRISFEKNKVPLNYSGLVYDLHSGDQIILPNGQEYVVEQILGHGELTMVIEVKGGKVMRMPLKGGDDIDALTNIRFQNSMNAYMGMQKELKAAGISVIEVDHKLSQPPFAIFVEKKDFLFKGDQFFEMLKSNQWETFSNETIKKARKSFLKFMEETWAYVDIGDFGPRQMGFDGEKWTLFDFDPYTSPSHLPLRNFEQKEIVGGARKYIDDKLGSYKYRFIPKEIEDELYKNIKKIRKKMKKNHSWFERSTEVTTGQLEFISKVTLAPLEIGHTMTFDLTDFYFKKLAKGHIPDGTSLEIKISGKGNKDGNIMTYPVLINKKDKGEIKIVLKNSEIESKEIIKIQKKEGKKNTYLKGDDFILFF